jgi:hypothetical protein
MPFGDTFADDIAKLILNATAIANIADNASASPDTNTYMALHTGDPVAGTQNTSEISYTGYARVALARTSGGWTIAGRVASPAADTTFGAMTAGAGGTVTFVSIGRLTSGAGKILFSGALSPTIAVANGSIPKVSATSSITF